MLLKIFVILFNSHIHFLKAVQSGCLQVNVKINEGKDLAQQYKQSITQDLKSFLQPVREKLSQFEQELKER